MSNYGSEKEPILVSSDSDTSNQDGGEVFKRGHPNLEDEIQWFDSSKGRKLDSFERAIHDQDRDTTQCIREIERTLRSGKDWEGIVKGGVGRIRSLEEGVSNPVTLYLLPQSVVYLEPGTNDMMQAVLADDPNDLIPYTTESKREEIEGYFQTFSSVCIVIRTLPGSELLTIDILRKFESTISDPYIIIAELSDKNVYHWHMIWFTSRRTDNVKRSLLKILSDFMVSVSCQQTKSFKNLFKYILKDPKVIAVRNDQNLWYIALMQQRENRSAEPQETETFPTQMVKDFVEVMRKHQKYTLEEMLNFAPDVMRKYLHKPNIESIISNCKLYLLKPNDIEIILKRIVDQVDEEIDPSFFLINSYLKYQGINPIDFIVDFWKVITHKEKKKNTLVLQGPSNTGKTAFIRPLLDLFNWGEVQNGGTFMFQNCINKELLIWEEPLIGSDFVEICKRVFEGMTTQVSVKYKPAQTLYRTPLIITTNKDLWHYTSGDELPLKNRIFHYTFSLPGSEFPGWLRSNCGECRRSYWTTNRQIGSAIARSLKGDCSSSEPSEPSDFSDEDSNSIRSSNRDSDDQEQSTDTSKYYFNKLHVLSNFMSYLFFFFFYRKTFGSH